jgi:folate-binding protein YgfZ
MALEILDDRAIAAVTGAEARTFLQGLITNDVESLTPGRAKYAALLTPQGKIFFDFLLVEGDGALLLDCAKAARDALIKRLSMYRLRAKVTIEPRDQLQVVASSEETPLPSAIVFADPRIAALGMRGICATAELPPAARAGADYLGRRLSLGVPESADFGSDRMFALDAGLDELHALDFGKGCYVGQELTSRMKHRGTARKRLLPVESAGGAPLPPRDTAVTAQGRELGEISSSYGIQGFALLRLDRIAEAGGAPIEAGGAVIKIRKPGWLFA